MLQPASITDDHSMLSPPAVRRRRWRLPLVFLATWSLMVASALAATLSSLRTSDFDGLNNVLQLPLALPWALIPTPARTGWTHTTDAWACALMGLANGMIIAAMMERCLTIRDARTSGIQ